MGIKFDTSHKELGKEDTKEKKSILHKEIQLFGNGFSNRSKEDFYGELSVLLNSGINLKTALQIISEMQKKQKDKGLIERISANIVTGNSLSEALKEEKYFTQYEQQAIRIGEQTGQLPRITEDLRAYFNRKNELKRQIISSLSYPIIVLLLALVIVFFMLRFVVPMFVDIFKQNNVALPWITNQIVKLSHLVSVSGWYLLLVFILIIVGYRWLSKTQWYYRVSGKLQLKIPILGNYLKRIYLIQFTQAMALLTQAKIPVVTGIGLAKDMIRFYPLVSTLGDIELDLVQGEKLHESFSKYPIYDKKMIALLRLAEETNQTEYIFQKLYDQYSTELKYKGQMITSVFNLLLILFVGAIVGVILIAMYMPMFELSSVIG
ncbi:MAG TPA: type II secretion system F family protein [Flavobacteriaceae bacterium]|nr:type II secretion system F family protein [Flavobacteriaceae bacterium]|tara:strand:- start:48592 stop:49722 length:1131 start_codon:yes stop_codon:yes gene_type:complete